MCSLGAEGFREVGYVPLGQYVLNLDRSSLYVVLYEVVFDVNKFSAFGWSRVWGDDDCCLVVNEQGVGWVSGMCASTRRRRSQCACCVAAVAAKYSASHVESATTDCLAEVQLMGASWNMCTIPVL